MIVINGVSRCTSSLLAPSLRVLTSSIHATFCGSLLRVSLRQTNTPRPMLRVAGPTGRVLTLTSDSQVRQSDNNFADSCLAIHNNLSQKQVTKPETWRKLFALMKMPQHADSALELLLRDAAVREEVAWDWITHGYGRTIIDYVEAAARAGAYDSGPRMLAVADVLHLTINQHLIPNMMRKVLLAKPAKADALEELYELEFRIRGEHSGEGAYELARAYRQLGNARRVVEVLQQADADGLKIRNDFTSRLLNWADKRVDRRQLLNSELGGRKDVNRDGRTRR